METEEREERGSGRSQNVVHTLPRSMASVPLFLTGPLERIDPTTGETQVLVITADAETAVALAEAVLRMTGPAGIELFPVTTARRAARLMSGRPVLAAAGSPSDIRDLVRGSHLKLESVKAVVLAWADEILSGNQEDVDALEAVMSELPKDAARVVVTGRSEGRVNAFAERYLRRARREAQPEMEEGAQPIAIQYVTVTPSSRGTALRRLLDDMDPPSAAVIVADDDSEREASGLLRMLGYSGESSAVRVSRGSIEPATHAVVFYQAPTSRGQLQAATAASPVVLVTLLEPRELSTVKTIAGGEVKPFTLSAPGNTAREKDAAMRRELGTVLDAGIASREVLALEPLLERYDGIEIAAAALRLLEKERASRKAHDEMRAQKETPRGFARDGESRGRPERGSDRGERSGPRDFRGAREGRGRDSGPPRRSGPPRGGPPSRSGPSRGGPPRGEGRPPRRDSR